MPADAHHAHPMGIIVMGVSACGKSTLGAALAQTLHCAFLEGDDFHAPEAVAKMRAGTPLTDLDRWPWLDRLGHAMSAEIARTGIAVASCSALKRTYRDRLRQEIPAPVVFVMPDASREELAQRLTARTSHYMPASLLDSQLGTLERPGPDERTLILDATLPTAILCERVLAWLPGNTR